MRKMVRTAAPFLLIIALVVGSFGAGCITSPTLSPQPSPTPGSASRELDLIIEAWNVLFEDFVEKAEIDPRELSRGAIRGLIEALGDPYSAYINAEHYTLEQAHFEGTFSGIGAMVTIEDGQLAVVSPIPGAPAERAGIRSGDEILEIDGESTENISLIEAVLKIRGETGTQVTLRVLHQGGQSPQEIVITREEIKVASVYSEMFPDNIAHIRLTYFSARTESELVSALNDILAQDAAGIILDLRDNPGGILDAAVAVASQFLEQGLVLYAMDSDGRKDTWEVEEGGLAPDLPLAVLVNGGSASASEVVVGALQDQGRALLIGTTTLGKGSINHFRELSDGSAIYITIGRWYTPNGRLIEGQGLSPDWVVERTAEDIEKGDDPQLERAIEYLRSQ